MVSMDDAAKNKKYYGLGSYLPKMPSYLQKRGARTDIPAPPHSQPAMGGRSGMDGDEDEPTDELRSLPGNLPTSDAVPSATADPTRRRGMSLEQGTFGSTMFKRLGSFRHTASDGSDAKDKELATSPSGSDSARSWKVRVGACVSTKFGTGTVLALRASDGMYIVELVPKCLAYLQEDQIVREIKSVVGERVKTRWGMATVEQYYMDEDMYNIALDWRWDDDHVWRMKATTKKFEKIPRTSSIVRNTKHMLFEGYSTIRESASTGYANMASRMNTTSTSSAVGRPSVDIGASVTASVLLRRGSQDKDLGRAHTPFGIGDIARVRADEVFVVGMTCGATGYFPADAVRMLHRRTHYMDGERVKTPYGVGLIVRYREVDATYEIKMDGAIAVDSLTAPMLYITDMHAESQLLPAPPSVNNLERLSSLLNMTRNTMASASASVKATVKARVSTMATARAARPKFQKGERVVTKMGSGFVLDVRPSDRLYVVRLRRLNIVGYFQQADLIAFPYERVTHFIVDGKTIPAPDMPRNLSAPKRRDIISSAIRQAQSRDTK